MRLVFAGTPETAIPSLEAILESEHELLAVITRPDAPSGRGKRMHPSPIAERALAAGIEVLRPERVTDAGFVNRLSELSPDCCPVVAYGALIPQRVIDIPGYGWVNLHFSLLPAWRGAAPVQHAIMHGDQQTGASTFALVPQMDAGPIYTTLTEEIGDTDTAGDVLHRLATTGAGLLVDTLDRIAAGALEPTPQPDTGISMAPKISTADAEIDWTQPAGRIDRQIRACQPDPGAWSTFRGEHFKIDSATVQDQSDLRPGELEATKKSLRAGAGSGCLRLHQVQPPGKKPMSAPDWARGVQFSDGEQLGM